MQIYQIYKDGNGNWSWKFINKDKGKDLAFGANSFQSSDEVLQFLKQFRKEIEMASVSKKGNEKNYYQFRYNDPNDKKYFWELVDNKGNILAKGNVDNPDNIERDLEELKEKMGSAKVEYKNPKDDPANQDKDGDNTKSEGIPGS